MSVKPFVNGAYAHDVVAVMHNATAVMLMHQSKPILREFYSSYVDTFFVPINLHGCRTRE